MQIGFEEEDRLFKGHLTVLRIKKRVDQTILAKIIKDFKNFKTEQFVVDKLILFKSDLKQEGPVYHELSIKILGV